MQQHWCSCEVVKWCISIKEAGYFKIRATVIRNSFVILFFRYESLMKQAAEKKGEEIKQADVKAGGVLVWEECINIIM